MVIFLLGAILGLLLGVFVTIVAMLKFNFGPTNVASTIGGILTNGINFNKEGK